MNQRKTLIWTVAFFLTIFCSTAWASSSNIYISQSGTGTGTSCGNAEPLSWLNNSANWGASANQIGPGTTIHLCGTITGTANQNIITFYGSGTAGNPITLKWEPGTKLTSPVCPGGWNLGCVYTGSNTNLVIDGNGTNPSITATNNGSALGGYAYHTEGTGIYARGCSNCEIKNITITNMYVMTDPNDSTAESIAILISESSNTSIHDSLLDQTEAGISDSFANGDTNLSFYNNTFDHFNWGIGIGQNNSNVISNVYIHNNHFKNMNTWDSTGDWYHHDGIFFYNTPVNTVNNFYIYNNLADGDMGNNATAWIYFNTGMNGIYVFNNVFLNPYARDVFMLEGGISGDHDVYVVNNYFGCDGGSKTINVGFFNNFSFKNNAINNCHSYIYAHDLTIGTGGVNYNLYENGATGSSAFEWNTLGGTFAQYQTATGNDSHSLTPTSAGLDSTGHPQAGSAVIGAGTNLSSLGPAALNADAAGAARPSSGAWDMGAYQYSSTPQPNYHPADASKDWSITLSEYLAYANCWKTACNWNATGTIPLSYYLNAANIWKYGPLTYHSIASGCPPGAPSSCWVPGA